MAIELASPRNRIAVENLVPNDLRQETNEDVDFFDEVLQILKPEDPSVHDVTIDASMREDGIKRRGTVTVIQQKNAWALDDAGGKLSYSKMIFEKN